MNDHPREPQPPEDVDEFYRRASALDPSRPGDHVRRSVLAHAERLASARARLEQKHPRWRPAVFGTLAAAVLAGLVIAPHWLRLPSPAAPAAQSQLAREAVHAAPMPAAPTPAAPAPAPAAGAAGAPAAPPAIAHENAEPTPREYSGQGPLRSRSSPLDTQVAPADANAVAGTRANADSITSTAPRSSAARSAAAPAAPRAQIAPQETLQQAADAGDLPALRRLLGANTDIDARDSQGRTALMHAVLHRQAQAVELLLAAGASPNAADGDGTTPLQAAEAGGERGIVGALQHYGAH